MNYAQVYGEDAHIPDRPDTEREREEAHFQISLKSRLLECFPIYFAYTQRSHWQVYDEAASRPFRETNFNPEFF
ncbi:MAG: phospholipase A, partial [Gammaproteobacteria bacterium]|nr:phospholipase A [Gammaproteobacteria bacterium]NIR31763.1 phospholipase A [Gammaproteobacteria bacterium]NIR98563.1 phospholipase A [Gammaproteobacteria bacterium]NIT64281.1 phospholipase A [Gammaproteobacteria bacterium]NIV21210.1 hypothetical protein [Gammaproteobacteria bacterium]